MNKRGQYSLGAIFGIVGAAAIILTLLGALPWWWVIVGIAFIILAFLANEQGSR